MLFFLEENYELKNRYFPKPLNGEYYELSELLYEMNRVRNIKKGHLLLQAAF